jgi:hypothetical protein
MRVEVTMTADDPFVGTWTLNRDKSEFDPNHRPTEATMVWEVDAGGFYVMKAHGTSAKGEPVAERPQRFTPDDRGYPVPDFPGLTMTSTRLEPRAIQTEVRREDGSIVGQGKFVISADGKTMTATNSGYDTQLRQFRQFTVWNRMR